VQFLGAHFGGLIAGDFLFIFSSKTCSKSCLQYHNLISLFMDCLSTFRFAATGKTLCCLFIIQLYHRLEVVLRVVDGLFFGCS
jgi:hypothetical protein